MHEAVDDVISRRRVDPVGLGRAMSISTGIHVVAVLVLFLLPRDWLVTAKTEPLLMTISLGGSPGEKSGGMVAAGARPVEEVAPPPKRLEPIPAAVPPKTSTMVIPTKPPKTPPKPVPDKASELTPSVLNRPPTTGAQVTKGTAAAETRSTTQSTGLTFGGGGVGDAQITLDSNFCCPEYIGEFQRRILANWKRDWPESGTITVVFEILKDGTFTPPQIEKTNGSVLLEIASKAAFKDLRLPPLPKEYKEDRLKIHLSFPYVR